MSWHFLKLQKRGLNNQEIKEELNGFMAAGFDGTSDVVDAHIKNILEKMWQHSVSHHEALLVMKFLVELEEIPECGKTLHKNFIVVFFHLMTYAVYCTEKKVVATTLTEKLVGKNGNKISTSI